jgi:RecA/RadA recombinase
LPKLPTGSKIIDGLLGGGVPFKLVTAIFSPPAIGKSWAGYQIGVNNIKITGKETLLIDTEGLTTTDLENILGKLRLRFDVSEKEVKNKFKMIKTYDDPNMMSIQKLLQMFGFMVLFELSERGKYKVTFQHCEATLNKKQLNDISFIILDSLTKPIKDSVGSESANLPARAQIVERLFGRLHHIAQVYNIAVIVLHHASCPPPVGRYAKAPYAYGGNPVYYNSKYILELFSGTNEEKKIKCGENKKKTWGLEARRIRLQRHPSKQPDGEKIPIRLQKDVGFVDV